MQVQVQVQVQVQKRLLAHPPEPGYPCYVSVLGELAKVAPREEPKFSLGHDAGWHQPGAVCVGGGSIPEKQVRFGLSLFY